MTPIKRALSIFFTTAASILPLVGLVKESFANALSIEQRASNTDQIQLEWPSQTGMAYSIYQSESLESAFTVQSENIQATPPQNTWWADKAPFEKRFFKVQAYGEAPSVINANSDFLQGTDNWNTPIYEDATANISVIDGELSVDITNGSSELWHIFIRQLGIPFVENQSYTLLFDARAAASRDIRVNIRDENTTTNFLSTDITISNIDEMQTYRLTFTATSPDTSNGRLTFLLGNDDNALYFDNIRIFEGAGNIARAAAHRMNTRLFRGNNFMAAKAVNDQGALDDYSLLNNTGFSHCRIGYKMDEVASTAPNYELPSEDLKILQKMADWCLEEGLIAVIDPVHNWANNNNTGGAVAFAATEEEYNKLGKIWEQVADHFAGYDNDSVVFEVFNEPHNGHDVARIISTSLSSIRSSLGNEERIVIVPGDGFSTRQALIDAFNNDEIPFDDLYIIGTFHYYDPFSFTKVSNTNPGYNPVWGTTAELAQVATDFDAVVSANNSWATRNLTEPLPIYLGEFGVDNEADNHGSDRKKWLSWIRMQAEARGMSWAHWNMYQNQPATKGMGEWTYGSNGTIQNPSNRAFDPDPLEALVGHYEFENGSLVGGLSVSQEYPGFKGSGYVEFPETVGNGIFIRSEDLYIPVSATYAVKIHYSSDTNRTLRVVSGNFIDGSFAPANVVGSAVDHLFQATGGHDSWRTQTVNLYFEAGPAPQLKIVANTEPGVNLDWLELSLPQP
ncbi:MAG: cellulase family glycosylhydrolase [Verrucomicrobiota bacterium]|nr:cellulase family glycosylhydrolase [Verrucomicrobiota bacterium]